MMVLPDAETTDEFHHQKEGITTRTTIIVRINEKKLEDVQPNQTLKINQDSQIEIEDLIQKEHTTPAGHREKIPVQVIVLNLQTGGLVLISPE